MSKQKGSLFLGLKKNRDGSVERLYYDPEYHNSAELSKTIKSITLETGLLGGELSISKASKTISGYIDSNYSNLQITRRKFLTAAAITAITGGLVSCGKDDPPIEATVDLPIPMITGPTELTIPRVGMGAIGTFDSAGTKSATDFYWQLIKPLSMMDTLDQKGSGTKIDISFPIPGTNEVRLIADNTSGRSRISLMVKVNPPELPTRNYDLPLLFMIQESYGTQRGSALYTMDINTMEVTKLFSGNRFYGHHNWEPSGQRIAFVIYPSPGEHYPESPFKIMTYDFIKGTFKEITNNRTGMVWSPTWSPNGDWIAYLDDSESINYALDVISLMRPDGSDQFYLDGAGRDNAFSGQSLSWDPEGKRLIAGANQKTHFKLVVFNNLFSGNPIITSVLPTNQQLERYYDSEAETFTKIGLTKDLITSSLVAGANGGVAWSPKGDVVAFTGIFGMDPSCYTIFLSRVDGTGDIQTIARAGGAWVSDLDSDFPLLKPTWTADGSAIYFSAQKKRVLCLFKYDLATKKYEELILPIAKANWPTLYG